MRPWIGKVLAASVVATAVYAGVIYGQVDAGPVAAAAPAQAVGHPVRMGRMGLGGNTTGMGGGMMGGWTAGGILGTMTGSAMAGQAPQIVPPAQAVALGNAVPAGASLDGAKNRITFTTNDIHLTVLASPDNGPDMTFRIAGLADPTVVVPQGARMTVRLIDADSGTAHGWLLTAAQPPFPYMAMMAAPAAFPGSFAMPLGAPTAAGMPSRTIAFTASSAGQYTYLCPVPGHAQRGMHGRFIVTDA